MQKILFYICSMQIGGAQRVIANLVERLSDNDTSCVLVNDTYFDKDIPEYYVSPKVKRFFLQRDKSNRLTKNLFRIIDLRRIIKKERPDVVIAFMGPPNIRMLIASIGLKTKKIVSVRNDPNIEYGTGLRRIAAGFMFGLADGIVFQTKDAAEYFPLAVRKKSKIIFNPVNPRFYEHHWKQGGTEIAVIGRLQPQKNPMNVMRAYELLHVRLPRYTLDFYGEGELRPELEEYAKEAGLSDYVRFHGRTNAVGRVLENAALFVLCSDYEGMPNVLMEAMAVGVPSIATDSPCGGSRALIENEDQGVLVACGDSDKLAEAMYNVLNDRIKQMRMSAAASKRACQFAPEKILREWEQFIWSV